LEIYADDVKCSHGASCGEIDKEQLFYLTSRGIDEPQALQILTEAHLEEIFTLIPNAKIQELFHNEK
jgi:Fe-S cluster assembly protein SufD